MSEERAKRVIDAALEKRLMVATAESCTGGLISAALTDVAGSSAVFERGFVTYSNRAKATMLGVPLDLTREPGAVSAAVAQAMVAGALTHSTAHAAVAVTGIAGPGGGSDDKPVGLVYIAAQRIDRQAIVREFRFADEGAKTRADVRRITAERALDMLLEVIEAG